jgi:hypothetical protein
MAKSNVEIAKDLIEAYNANNFDKAFGYCAKGCVVLRMPYVGLGIGTNQHENGKIIISKVNPKGPSAGIVEAGDEVIRVSEGVEVWEGPELLKKELWALGVLGGEVKLRIRRRGETMDITLTRALIRGSSMPLRNAKPDWEEFAREWPDHHESVVLALGDGDLVAILSVATGTNRTFGKTATWGSTTFMRFKGGKVTEIQGIEEELMQIKQLGYVIREPEKPKVG